MKDSLSAIRGQNRAVAMLSRCLESGRVPPGLLLYGEEGIGKETAARAFAAALLCRKPRARAACLACPDCLLVAAGSHPNVLRIAPDNHFIRIDEIRRLQEELSLKAFSDRPRAALVSPADRMTLQAANALLKTLEEPPAGTVLLLVAHRLSPIPATIVSRCLKVPFAPLAGDDVAAVLRGLPAADGYPAEAIRAAAACSGGSPGRALRLLEEGGEDRDAWIGLIGGAGAGSAVFAASEAWKNASEPQARLAAPLSVLRDVALLSSGAGKYIMNADLGDALGAAAGRKTPEVWTRSLGALLSMTRMSPQAQKRLLMEAFLFAMRGKD